MEGFKDVIKRRRSLIISFNGLAVVFIALTGIFGNMAAGGSENLADMIRGFQVGVFVGLEIVMTIYVAKYSRALKNETELKKLYFSENDERIKLIHDKIGGTGFNFTLCVISASAVIAGFLNQTVFVTLLGVLIFISFVKGFLKIYYRNKY